MPAKRLKFKSEKTNFGTKVTLSNKDTEWTVAEYLKFNPVRKTNKKLVNGYLFRSPGCKIMDLKDVIAQMEDIADYNFWVEQDQKSNICTAYILINDQDDAMQFAFGNMSDWQKWSQADEEEEAEASGRKPIVTQHDDGRITVDIEVDTLDIDDPADEPDWTKQ
jgi:hypothetical protein